MGWKMGAHQCDEFSLSWKQEKNGDVRPWTSRQALLELSSSKQTLVSLWQPPSEWIRTPEKRYGQWNWKSYGCIIHLQGSHIECSSSTCNSGSLVLKVIVGGRTKQQGVAVRETWPVPQGRSGSPNFIDFRGLLTFYTWLARRRPLLSHHA